MEKPEVVGPGHITRVLELLADGDDSQGVAGVKIAAGPVPLTQALAGTGSGASPLPEAASDMLAQNCRMGW